MTSYHEIVPYQKNAQMEICPSDTSRLNVPQALTNLGAPPACSVGVPLAEVSYQPNYAIMPFGSPINPNPTVVALAQINVPASTSLFSDSTVSGRGAYPLLNSPIQSR